MRLSLQDILAIANGYHGTNYSSLKDITIYAAKIQHMMDSNGVIYKTHHDILNYYEHNTLPLNPVVGQFSFYSEEFVTQIKIPKKSKGYRIVHDVYTPLKNVLTSIKNVLTPIIEKDLDENIFGSITGKGPVDCAKKIYCEGNNKFGIVSLDLKNFFPSITSIMIQNALQYYLEPEAAKYISRLCCYKGRNPQGYPTASILACLVANSTFFPKIKNIWTNSYLYVDNLYLVYDQDLPPIEEIKSIIQSYGFKTHKEWSSKYPQRIEVLGLIVNKDASTVGPRVKYATKKRIEKICRNHRISKYNGEDVYFKTLIVKKWVLEHEGSEVLRVHYLRKKKSFEGFSHDFDTDVELRLFCLTKFNQWLMGQLNWLGQTDLKRSKKLKKIVVNNY